MVKIRKSIQNLIMQVSLQERRKKNLQNYRQEIRRFQNMERDELDLEYINLKTEYEHKKSIMSIFLLSIVLSVLMDIWKYFYNLIEKAITYNAVYHSNETEIIQIAFIVFVILILFISSVVFGILLSYTRRMRLIYRKMLIIEELRKS